MYDEPMLGEATVTDWKTLVVPLDGSPLSEAVLAHAEALATALGGSLHLLSVVERKRRGLTRRSVELARGLEEEQQSSLEAYLTTLAAALHTDGMTARATVAMGSPAESILAIADNDPTSIIAMTTHGRAGVDRVDRWSIGGVADKVMRLSTRPTLLLRLPYTRADHQVSRRGVTFAHLLVPLDGSDLAEAALIPAAELAATVGARLTLLRVEPWLTEGSARYGTVPEFTALEEEAAATATTYLTDIRRRLSGDLQVDTDVLRGRPAESLIDFALHERVDLVVMTTHGRGGLHRLILGSTADRMVRSGIPTLLIRPSAAAPVDSQ